MSQKVWKWVQFAAVASILTLLCHPATSSSARRLLKNRMSSNDLRKPFVLLYEHESFRGKEYVQFISKACENLPQEYFNWASSVDTHRACASVCANENCQGPCYNVYSNQGVSKLRIVGFNDKIKSVKTCF